MLKNSILNQHKHVDVEYKDDYWKFIEEYKIYKNLDSVELEKVLNNESVLLYDVLSNAKIVTQFDELIKTILLNESSSAELLIDKYEIDYEHRKSELHFPKALLG